MKADKLPALFIGHGSPMNAALDNPFTRAMGALGKALPRPRAILCVSAHWLTEGELRLSGSAPFETIYDFYGFPDELYRITYAPPPAGEAARATAALLTPALLENITGLIGGFYLRDWIGILYLGFFGTVLGFFWYYQGIKAIGPSRASVFINFVPVSGVFFGWLMLDEAVNLSLLTGAALVLSGVYLTNRPR